MRFSTLSIDSLDALYRQALNVRRIHTVFWHASASDRPEHDSAQTMHQWHVERGWQEIGYHGFVRKDGTLQLGRDWAKVPAAQSSFNVGTLAFCLHGLAKELFTPRQEQTMRAIAEALPRTLRHRGHREVSPKLCPVVDYPRILGLDRHGFLERADDPIPASSSASVEVQSRKVLRLFDRGEPVRELQKALGITDDGLFGQQTLAAVRAFQREKGLTVDGVVGQQTWAALK
jgi:N-acetylmuramoyl-L-alanine amidase